LTISPGKLAISAEELARIGASLDKAVVRGRLFKRSPDVDRLVRKSLANAKWCRRSGAIRCNSDVPDAAPFEELPPGIGGVIEDFDDEVLCYGKRWNGEIMANVADFEDLAKT